MGSRLNPYLNFQATAREAMEFYRDVFGGELQVMTFGDMGGEPADGVMHAQLETPDGFTLMASDAPPGETAAPGGSVHISLSGDDTEALTGWFEKLSDGGTVVDALKQQVWGDTFGMLVDRYGIGWLVNIAGEGAPA
ncbi:VOC family protein [Nocardioides euryhalodurans]|uniref:VOC family protein n=1 Tax=Nocardioides euryhalodurans TaxID=2518370 RepID=A0A4P7GM75_9ACTN|nr:VOC family protein [Nocardioides euryhalodurans]QBR92999.1 VOC family protein [Nocardioides euryhalodurans]